ncbi:hypothetical protein SD3246_2132 [Salmonella enterica subsp. enterica serovar Dublin str. SD3246]|uniref:Uncharacterized protein n=1 Tax=Salmonella enterica subsp. enterica serovar Dublin str. SD3246 TaxID=909945 RepID=A0A8X6JZV3_SALDU|nr:hypothetical protein SD3246_2132 [Salmonella enterica subsp. enterica serovar Dublin str. SD3246]
MTTTSSLKPARRWENHVVSWALMSCAIVRGLNSKAATANPRFNVCMVLPPG